MKKFIIVIILFLLFSDFLLVRAEESDHLVISEIKLTGGSGYSTDEFLELYNPTESDIFLHGWQLIKKTASGNEYILVEDFGELTVKAYSFFLVAHPAGYLGEAQPDFYYTTTNSISSNNTIILLDGEGNVIDKVGMGTALDFEGEAAANPGSGKSIERKAKSDSTDETMIEGGVHYFLGNGEDLDDNAQDFISRSLPEPQNSASEQEYLDIEVPEIPELPLEEPEQPTPAPQSPEPENAIPVVYSNEIIITEILPNPEGKDDNEFIELFNEGSVDVDLAGWKLGDNSARLFTIKNDDFKTTIIRAGSYFIIVKEASGISLNNTTDSAKLFHPDEILVYSIEYEDCQEAQSYSLVNGEWLWTGDVTPGLANKFIIKNEPPLAVFELEEEESKVGRAIVFDAAGSSDADGDELEFLWSFGDGEQAGGEKVEYTYEKEGVYSISLIVKDAKGSEDEAEQELIITDYDYSDNLFISEILPACSGSDLECEFIEIYNNDSQDINLEDWILKDAKTEYSFTMEDIVKSKDYLLVKRVDSKITLNNSGESIFLLDPAGKIINGVEFGKATKDLSFARELDSNNWLWTEKPTPGQANELIITESEEEQDSDKAESKEVKAAAVNNEPFVIGIGEINEDYLGRLLKVKGELESKKSVSYYLMDDLGNILRMYIQKKTNIPKLSVEVGDTIEVVGILDKTSAGLRLLPRTQEDIVIIPKKAEGQAQEGKVLGASTEKEIIDVPVKDNNGQVKLYLYIGIGAAIVAGAVVGIRIYLKKKKEADSTI